jgi:hypothetical protein
MEFRSYVLCQECERKLQCEPDRINRETPTAPHPSLKLVLPLQSKMVICIKPFVLLPRCSAALLCLHGSKGFLSHPPTSMLDFLFF